MKKLYQLLAIGLFSSILHSQQNNPFGFVENKGQIIDQNGRFNSDVYFVLNSLNNNVALRKNGFSYNLFVKKNDSITNTRDQFVKDENYIFNRIDIDFLNCNSKFEVIVTDTLAGFTNYFNNTNSEDDIINVNSFRKILYKNIYNNIDIEFVSNSNDSKFFEYNFILHPNARLSDIVLKYKGFNDAKVSYKSIDFGCSIVSIKENIPASYYKSNKQNLNFEYEKINSFKDELQVSFICKDKLKKGETIIIDPTPTLTFGSFYGGSSGDGFTNIRKDNNGNIYIIGQTRSISNIATSGAYQTTISGNFPDIFLVKFNSNWQRKWATYFGGANTESAFGLGINSNGQIFVCGNTESASNIATMGAYQQIYEGVQDAFLASFDSLGNRVWCTYVGGNHFDRLEDLAINQNNDIYIVGYTSSPNNISTPSSFQPSLSIGYNLFINKFSSNGFKIWGTYFGSQMEPSPSVALYGNDVFISGTTSASTGIASSGAQQVNYGGGSDAFLAKFSNTGNRVWSTYLGSSDDDRNYSLCADGSGNLYMVGYTNSTSGFATSGVHQSTIGGFTDGYIAKYTNTGSLLWNTYYGGEFYDGINDVTVNTNNDVLIVGYTNSTLSIATPSAYQGNFAGGLYDGILAKFNSNGTINYGTYYGTPSNEGENKLICSGSKIYIVGSTSDNTGALCTSNAYQATSGGAYDGQILEFFDPATVGIVENYNYQNNIKVYPNPNNGCFTIETLPNSIIEIYDIMGRCLLKKEGINEIEKVNLENVEKGIYFLRVNNNYTPYKIVLK